MGSLVFLLYLPLRALGLLKQPLEDYEYLVKAPNTPRPLQPTLITHVDNASLDVRVRISSDRCMLSWGVFTCWSDWRFTQAQRNERLAQPWQPEPIADAAYIADLVNRILDDRMGLFRAVHETELYGMGGPIGLTFNARMMNLEQDDPVFNAKELKSMAQEALLYTWSGRGDARVVLDNPVSEQSPS